VGEKQSQHNSNRFHTTAKQREHGATHRPAPVPEGLQVVE
jgi:hypothetical protein